MASKYDKYEARPIPSHLEHHHHHHESPGSPRGSHTGSPRINKNHSTTVSEQPKKQLPFSFDVGENMPAKPQNYMLVSIFTMIFCGCLFGMIAIGFSVMSDSKYNKGDVSGARRFAQVAIIIDVIGIIFAVMVVVIIVLSYISDQEDIRH